MSLRVRWTLVAILLSVVPVVTLAAFALRGFRSGLEASERALENVAIVQLRSGLGNRLEHAEDVTRRVGLVLGDGAIAEDEVRERMARDLLGSEPALERISVYAASGARIDDIVQGTPHAPGFDSPAWLSELPDGAKPGWVVFRAAAKQPELSVLAPIGTAVPSTGSALGRVDLQSLRELTAQVAEGAFPAGDARVVVFDSDGRVVAGRGDTNAAGAFARLVGITPNSDDSVVTRTGLSMNGAAAVGTLGTLKRFQLTLVVMRPEAEAFPDYYRVRTVTLLTTLVLFVLALLAAAILARRTTAPILALVALTKRYAGRAFATRSTVKTGDELEALGSSLEGMADALSAGEVELLKRAEVQTNLSRFLPEAIAAKIARGEGHVDLGGSRREVTVLFADVCAFTRFSERAPPEVVVAFLNELFGLASEVVFRHGGIVDKFLGDSLMALFGATDEESTASGPSHAARALACAEDIHRFVESSAPGWRERFDIEVRMAIGVNTGPAVVGNLGSKKRMEFTAIGDTINVAARLEALARPGQTLLTDAVVAAAPTGFDFVSLGAQPMRGKAGTVAVFELEAT
jgi:adenylate cyclase